METFNVYEYTIVRSRWRKRGRRKRELVQSNKHGLRLPYVTFHYYVINSFYVVPLICSTCQLKSCHFVRHLLLLNLYPSNSRFNFVCRSIVSLSRNLIAHLLLYFAKSIERQKTRYENLCSSKFANRCLVSQIANTYLYFLSISSMCFS